MSTRTLDHILHLTPPGSIAAVSAQFRALGFTVVPGGTHADGHTYNALVPLADGTYIELIAFVAAPAPPRPTEAEAEAGQEHRWAAAPPGWLDYAHLALAPDVGRAVSARSGGSVRYDAPVEGGRPSPAGHTLRWRVTFPERAAHGVAQLPFFCEDLTPREWRVPAPSAHANTARGIAHITLHTASTEDLAARTAQLSAVLGSAPATTTADGTATWVLATPTTTTSTTPAPLPATPTPTTPTTPGGAAADLAPRLILARGTTPAPRIAEVGFWVDKTHGGGGGGGAVDTPHARIVWVPVPA